MPPASVEPVNRGVTIEVEDLTLNAIAGAYKLGDCSRRRYQQTAVWVTAAYGGYGLPVTLVDVTCQVELASSDESVFTVTERGQVQGEAVGLASLRLANSPSSASVNIITSDTEVYASIGGGAQTCEF